MRFGNIRHKCDYVDGNGLSRNVNDGKSYGKRTDRCAPSCQARRTRLERLSGTPLYKPELCLNPISPISLAITERYGGLTSYRAGDADMCSRIASKVLSLIASNVRLAPSSYSCPPSKTYLAPAQVAQVALAHVVLVLLGWP